MIKWLPNILTLGRLVLTVVFLLMILYSPQVERQSLFLDVAFVLFVVAGVTDVVDGHVARRFDATSKFGRIVDPLVDKVLVCGTFTCFAVVGVPTLFGWGAGTLAVIHWSVLVILFSREAYVTVLRHVAEAKGVNFAATKSGKFKMLTQVFAIGTVLIKTAHVPEAAWADWFTTAIFALMVGATIVSGFLATRRPSWKQLKEEAGTHEPSTTST